MRIEVTDKHFKMIRNNTDKPLIEVDYTINPAELPPGVYNAGRKEYRFMFGTPAEAERARIKCINLGDFDKACVWLDKQ